MYERITILYGSLESYSAFSYVSGISFVFWFFFTSSEVGQSAGIYCILLNLALRVYIYYGKIDVSYSNEKMKGGELEYIH